MNSRNFTKFPAFVIILTTMLASIAFGQSTSYYDFNTTGQLATYFNKGGTTYNNISQTTNTGIGGTGAVNVSGTAQTFEVYTTKAGYTNGGVGTTYAFSTYFKSEGGNGWGGLGFTDATPSANYQYAAPQYGLGVNVHGGGFEWTNNTTAINCTWGTGGIINYTSGGDLLGGGSPDNWYKVILTIEVLASSQYKMTVEVFPSYSNGTLLPAYTTTPAAKHTVTVANPQMASANVIYSYFGFGGYRITNFDNYGMNLDGATIIEPGAPILTGTASYSTANTRIDMSGNISSDRGSAITERGFVWSTTADPTIATGTKILAGTGTGTFTGVLNSPASGTYYVKAYATNANGTSYGAEQTVVITCTGTLPTVAPVTSQTLCRGASTTPISFSPVGTAGFQWMTINGVSSTTATGTGQNGITASITHSGGGMSARTGMYSANLFPAEYSVPSSGTQIRNDNEGIFTVTFSQPVTNPLIAFASVGSPNRAVPVIVSAPFTPIWSYTGTPGWTTTYDLPNNKFTGAEGFNIIRIDGTVTSVSFNYTVAESYSTVCFGFVDQNVTYNWTNSDPTIGLAATGTGNILSFAAQNASGTPKVANITVTPVQGACEGTPETFTITVNPKPDAGTISGTLEICEGSTSTLSSNAAKFPLDRGLSFNGTHPDIVTVNSAFPVASGDFTIEAWVKPTLIDAQYHGFFGADQNGRDPSMWVGPNGTLHTDSYDGSTRYDIITANNFFSANTWTHVAWVKEGTTYKVYRNGVLNITDVAPSNATILNNYYWFGRVDNFFSGSLDEFRIWNVARTQDQIQVNMNKEVAAQTNLVAYYNFNNGTPGGTNTGVTTLSDNSGGTRNGTLSSFTLSGATSNWVEGALVGGNWTSSNTSVATVDALSGEVTGVSAGTSTITYTMWGPAPCGSSTATADVTISAPAAPATITGTQAICAGSTTQFTATVASRALDMDGTNDYVSLPSGVYFDDNTFTIESWVYVKSNPNWHRVVDFGNGASNNTVTLALSQGSSGYPALHLYDANGNSDRIDATRALPLNQWVHIAAVRNGTTGQLYVNGELWASNNALVLNTANVTRTQCYIGRSLWGVDGYSNAKFGEVRIWSVARTAAQISSNANAILSPQTGLVAYYRFNQGTPDANNAGVTTLTDYSGNSYNGTLNNFALTGTTSNWTSRNAQASGTWSSSNTAVATVDQNGLVTGVAGGTATISFTATGQGGCADVVSTRTVTVSPAISVDQVASQYLNTGGTTSPVVFTSSTAGATFNWTNSNTSIIPVSQASGNIASFAVTNTGTAPVSTTISVTATGTSGGITCTSAPMTFQIVVNPVAVMNQPANVEDCPGATITPAAFTSANTGGTVTYSWTNNNTSIGLAASGTGNISAFTATNTTSDYQVATITVTPTYTNGGTSNTGASTTFTITVKPNSSVTQVANQVYCNGATGSVSFGSPVSGTTYAWTNSNTAIGLAASGTGNIANFQTTNTGITAISGTVTVTPTSNGCVGSPITFTITVNPTPTATTTTTSQVVCDGATVPASTFTTPVAGTVVNWSNSNPSIGLAASGTGNIPSFTATNTGNAPAVGTITVRPTLGTGTSGRLSYTMYSTHAGNGNTSQYGAYAYSAAEFDVLFNTANSNTTVHATGEANASGLLTYYSQYDLINNGVPVPNGGEFYGVKIVGTFIPVETGNYVFAVDGDDAVDVLLDGSVVASYYGAHGFGGLQQGQPVSLVAGRPYTFMARMQEYGGGDGLVVAWKRPSQSNFTTQTDEIFGEACYGPSITYTVTVNPIPTVATQTNQLVCAGSTVTANFAGAVTGTVYSWTNSNPAIGLAASGTGSTLNFTATNAGPSPISGTITVTPSFTNGGVTCTGTPVTFTITVNPKGQVNAVNNQVLCNGSATSAVTFTTTNNGLISSGGSQTASSGTISVSVPDGSAVGATSTLPVTLPAGAVISNVRVTLNLTHTWISDMVINLKAPNGQILNLFNAHGGSGDNLVNTVVSSTGTTTFASGAAPFTGTFAATAASGVGPTGNVSNAANFAALYSTPNGNWTLAMRDLWGGDLGTLTGWSISFDYAVQGAFGTNMNWTNSNSTIGLAASGTGHIPSFTATNNGTTPVVSTVTVTPTYFNGGLSCAGAPITYTYTVNPTPTVNTVATQTFCAGTPATVTHAGTVPGTVYSWTNSNTAIGLPASGTGNISFTPTNTGTTPILATITVTPSYTNAGVTCTGTPKTYTIMVNPVGQVNAITSQVLCNGSATTAVAFATVNGGGTVTPGTPITASSGAITVAIPDNNAAGVAHTIPVTLPVSSVVTKVTANFNITHTWDSDLSINLVAPNGQVLNLVNRRGGSGDNFTNTTISPTATTAIASGSAPFTGTYLPDAAIGAGSTSFASTAANFAALYSVGSGDWKLVIRDHAGGDVGTLTGWSLTFEYGALIPAVTTYAWTNNTPSIGLAASGTGNIASFTATNTTAAPVTSTVTVTPTYTNNGVGCAGTPITYTYTVNPTPTVNAVANQTVCRGSNVAAITFSGATTGTVYTWTNTNTAVGLAASGTGDIASFVGTNTTAAPITATITVTPRYTNGGVTCVGTPRTFTITVNPIPTVNAVTSFPVCHNSPVSVPFSGATTGTVYSWTNTNPAIGLAASGTGNLSFTATNPNTGGAPITATITVTPSYTNNGVTCVGTPTSFTITVNPLPVVSAGTLPSRICISDTLVKLNGTPVGGSWSGIGTSGMNFIPTATNIGSYALTYTYADINGCVNRATITANVLACEERNRDLDNGAVILYPNPNSGQFNLRINSTRFNVLGMKVYNTAGQLVSVKQWGGLVYGRVIPVNLTNLAAGIYVVRLYYGDGMDRGADKSYQIIIAR